MSADLRRVRVLCEGRPVADHERIWAKHSTISAAEHVAAARALRAERVGWRRPAPAAEAEIGALSDYDAAFGLTDGGVADQETRRRDPGTGGLSDPRAEATDPA